MENLQPTIDKKDAINSVGEILTAFQKSGPRHPDHLEEIYADISKSVYSIIRSVQDATAGYERVSKEFLDNVIEVRGMPTRVISSGDDNQAESFISSGSHIAETFDTLLPLIIERFKWCVENYRLQGDVYLSEQIEQFQAMLMAFLQQVPTGGTKDKALKSRITELKKELRYLAKWDQLFYTYKARSFPAEVDYIFALTRDPIAAIWHYSKLDEQGEYHKTYEHQPLDGCVYAIRGTWAIERGLMKVGTAGYLDEIGRPGREVGCMCSLQWVTGLRGLPGDMITDKGRNDIDRVTAIIQADRKPENRLQSVASDAKPSAKKSWFMGWLKRG